MRANRHMSRFSFAPASVRTSSEKRAGVRGAVAVLGLMGTTLTSLSLRGRAAWAHDNWSAPNITAAFQALPGSIFVVTGAAPATDLALVSAGAEIGFRNGFSVGARFDGEFAENSTKYSGMGRLRYTW
jgi:uncharacterized protein with beta-barrel porin domain